MSNVSNKSAATVHCSSSEVSNKESPELHNIE